MYPANREKIIEPPLIKDVKMGGYAILTPEDAQRYIRTRGVSTCTALTLHFPKAGIVVLSHIPASSGLHTSSQRIRRDLEGRTDESPFYFVEEGPYNAYNGTRVFLDEIYYGKKDPPILQQYFPGAKPSNRVSHEGILKGDDCIDVMIDKMAGMTRVYNGSHRGANLPREIDFETPEHLIAEISKSP